ncbi:hypothetical protein NP284_14760 [Rhodopseudomonas pseudopalustris]|nr:hypothetical protein [Rhodopseudomonas pseudopalustris]
MSEPMLDLFEHAQFDRARILDLPAEVAKKFVLAAHPFDVAKDREPAVRRQLPLDVAHQPGFADASRREHLDALPGFEQPNNFADLIVAMSHDSP